MTDFQKLVLRALAILVRCALWDNPFGSASDWNRDAQAIVRELQESSK